VHLGDPEPFGDLGLGHVLEESKQEHGSLTFGRRANGGSFSIGTDGPPIPRSVRGYSARSDWRFCFSLSASSSTRSACARLLSAWVRLA
jgi:hypothetical protein